MTCVPLHKALKSLSIISLSARACCRTVWPATSDISGCVRGCCISQAFAMYIDTVACDWRLATVLGTSQPLMRPQRQRNMKIRRCKVYKREKEKFCSKSELLRVCAELDACCCDENCLNAESCATVQCYLQSNSLTCDTADIQRQYFAVEYC